MVTRLANSRLCILVEEKGAELVSVVDKKSGQQRLWNGDDALWERHAPLLFPYCGGLFGDELLVGGKAYPAPKHGFARDTPFSCVRADAAALLYRLTSNDETRRLYPFDFVLEVAYTLRENTLHQTVMVQNTAPQKGSMLPFTLGFHPAFALPFTTGKKAEDYEIYFDVPESPIEIKTPGGYVSGGTQKLFSGKQSLRLSEDVFANDSICLSGLRSKTITLREIDSPKRAVRVNIEAFPYVLLWGPPAGPLPFVCIEPWHGLPDGPDRYADFADKAGITLLAPAERFETTLEMEFTLD